MIVNRSIAARLTMFCSTLLRGDVVLRRGWLVWAAVAAMMMVPQALQASCGHYIETPDSWAYAAERVGIDPTSGMPWTQAEVPRTPCENGQCDGRPAEQPFSPPAEPTQQRNNELLAVLSITAANASADSAVLRDREVPRAERGFPPRIDRPPR